MLRKLASYPRQNGLALVMREIGRFERTLFLVEWLLNPTLRVAQIRLRQSRASSFGVGQNPMNHSQELKSPSDPARFSGAVVEFREQIVPCGAVNVRPWWYSTTLLSIMPLIRST